MNARQKAKYYKKKYEDLIPYSILTRHINQPVITVDNDMKIVELHGMTTVHQDIICNMDNDSLKKLMVVTTLCNQRDFLDCVDMKISKDRSNLYCYTNKNKIDITVKMLMPEVKRNGHERIYQNHESLGFF